MVSFNKLWDSKWCIECISNHLPNMVLISLVPAATFRSQFKVWLLYYGDMIICFTFIVVDDPCKCDSKSILKCFCESRWYIIMWCVASELQLPRYFWTDGVFFYFQISHFSGSSSTQNPGGAENVEVILQMCLSCNFLPPPITLQWCIDLVIYAALTHPPFISRCNFFSRPLIMDY